MNHILGLGSSAINFQYALASYNQDTCDRSCFFCLAVPVTGLGVNYNCLNCKPGLNGTLNPQFRCTYACPAGNYPNEDYSNCVTCPSCCPNCELFTGNPIIAPYVPNIDDFRCNTVIPIG